MLVKVLFVLALASVGRGDEPQKVSMQVLYESECGDSRSFIQRQLRPVMRLLHNQIQLKFVPFGKASSIDGGHGGFRCQHGPSECQGNIVQDCTLDVMADRSDLDKTTYVFCEMITNSGARGNHQCMQRVNVSADAVNECLSSGRGTALQLESERITNQYRPSFIPTVVIDGVFNQQVQDSSQQDLMGTLCSILKQSEECAQYYNNFALRYHYL